MSNPNLTVEHGGRHSIRPRNIAREIARCLQRSEGGVQQDLYGGSGTFRRSEEMLEKLAHFGALELAQKQVKRFQDIIAGRTPQKLTPALLLEVSRADADEDVARTALQCALSDSDPNNDEPARREFVRRARHAIAELTELADAVAAGLP